MSSKVSLIFKDETDNIFLQFFRYIFVGGASFLIDFFMLYFFCSICGVHYLISAVLSFIISLIFNYILSTSWIFNRNKINNKLLEFNLFALIGIVGLGFTEFFLYFFTDIVGLYYLYSKIIAAALVLFWNFIARRFMFYGKQI